MPSPLIYPKFQGIAPNPIGAAAAGYKLKTFAAGTSTPLATFTDSTLAVANPTTIIMDANGEANVWLGALAYKFIFTDPADVVQWTADNVTQAGVGFGGGTTGAGAEWIPLPPPTFLGATAISIGGGVTDLTVAPYFLTQGTRIRTQNSGGVAFSTVRSIAGPQLNLINDSIPVDAGVSAAWYGIVSTYNSVAVRSMVAFIAGTPTNMVNGVPVSVNTGGALIVDKLGESSAQAQVTVKFAGTYNIRGNVLLNAGGATNGITLAQQTIQVRKNGVAAASIPVTWPFPNLTVAAMVIPFNTMLFLVVNDFIDMAAVMNFTATAPTASLISFNLERVQ